MEILSGEARLLSNCKEWIAWVLNYPKSRGEISLWKLRKLKKILLRAIPINKALISKTTISTYYVRTWMPFLMIWSVETITDMSKKLRLLTLLLFKIWWLTLSSREDLTYVSTSSLICWSLHKESKDLSTSVMFYIWLETFAIQSKH